MSIYHTLTPEQFDAIGQELDAIRNREIADLGEKDDNFEYTDFDAKTKDVYTRQQES